MLYLGKDGYFHSTEDDNEKLFFDLLQELSLVKGENPIRATSGIDYLSVFRLEAFLQLEMQEVISNHRSNFDSIEIGDISYEGETIKAPLSIVFKDGEIRNETIKILGY